jgi:regulatory protein
MDRTEGELRNRLSEEGFPEEIIQSTIEYVHYYGYLNDERYAINYIRQRKETKSKLIIRSELAGKGIDKELLDMIFTTEYQGQEEDPEITAIRKAIAKKVKEPDALSREEKQKLIAHLYRKGFEFDKIKKLVE